MDRCVRINDQCFDLQFQRSSSEHVIKALRVYVPGFQDGKVRRVDGGDFSILISQRSAHEVTEELGEVGLSVLGRAHLVDVVVAQNAVEGSLEVADLDRKLVTCQVFLFVHRSLPQRVLRRDGGSGQLEREADVDQREWLSNYGVGELRIVRWRVRHVLNAAVDHICEALQVVTILLMTVS